MFWGQSEQQTQLGHGAREARRAVPTVKRAWIPSVGETNERVCADEQQDLMCIFETTPEACFPQDCCKHWEYTDA